MKLPRARIGAAALALVAIVVTSAAAAPKPRWIVTSAANFHNDDVLMGTLPASAFAIARLGVDRGGRLWMAWAPGRAGKKSQARIVELDPATLKARS